MVTKLTNSKGKTFKTNSTMMEDCGDEYQSVYMPRDIETSLWVCEDCNLVWTRKHQAESCGEGTYPVYDSYGFGETYLRNHCESFPQWYVNRLTGKKYYYMRNAIGRIVNGKLQPIKPVEHFQGAPLESKIVETEVEQEVNPVNREFDREHDNLRGWTEEQIDYLQLSVHLQEY